MRRARGRTFEVAAHEDGEEAGGEEAGGQEAGGEEADGQVGLIDMKQELLGRGADLPTAELLQHCLQTMGNVTAELLLHHDPSMGAVDDSAFRSSLMPLAYLLTGLRADEADGSAIGTRLIEQYNSYMFELGVETEGDRGMQLPLTVVEALEHLRSDGRVVPFVVVYEKFETSSSARQLQLAAALTFEVKPPESAATGTVRLALWDVYVHKKLRQLGFYSRAHCAILEALALRFRGLVRIELSCKDVPELVRPHAKAGYHRTDGAAQEQPVEQLERVRAIVQAMHAAQPQLRLTEAVVLGQLDSELGGASGDRAALSAEVRGMLRMLCPSPLVLQPAVSDARVDWLVDEGVAPWIVRSASSWAGCAQQRLCQYMLASADGPSLLSCGARGAALTYPIAPTLEHPAHVSTSLRHALGLEHGATIPQEVALLSAIDLAAAALVGLPPPDLQGGTEQRDAAVCVLRAHLMDGRCLRGQWRAGTDGGRRKPCALCAAYPLVLAAMDQLVGLATRHVECCLPAAVERPPPASDDQWSDRNLRVVSVTLRRRGEGAKTKQEPPLWALCVHVHIVRV